MKSKYPPEERSIRNKAKGKEWREANRERLKEYMVRWREEHRDHVRDKHLAYRRAHPRHWRPRVLKQLYNMTLDDLRDMIVGQAGRCLVCLRVPPEDLVVDHDHTTGKVRGLLCQKCNRMLGHASDRVEVFQSAIRYLEAAR